MNPKQKPWICVENGCKKCRSFFPKEEVPDSCNFSILHGLDISDIGLHERVRRWGKTTRVIECVKKFEDSDVSIFLVTVNKEMVDYIKRRLNQRNVTILSKESFGDGSGRSGLVFTDEIGPEDVAKYKSNRDLRFVLGYYTRGFERKESGQ
jgi:hypothetical protein